MTGGHMQQMTHQDIKIVKEYKLDYCAVRYRENGIAEIEISEGVNVDADMASELMRMADELIGSPFGLISNRVHSYSLSFEAMSILAHYDNLAAVAIVVHSTRSRVLVETQNFFISALNKKNIKVFMDFDSAAAWLHDTLQEIHKSP